MGLLKRKLPPPSSSSLSANDENASASQRGPLHKRPRMSGTTTPSATPSATTSRLFGTCKPLLVQRAPFFAGNSLINRVTAKKFVRPMMKRRAYGKAADSALQSASLGPKRRMNGMAKLLARAGRGLTFQLPRTATDAMAGDTDGSSESEEETTPERPCEPLLVWKSPHTKPLTKRPEDDENGETPDTNAAEEASEESSVPAVARGLPPRLVQVTRPDDFGVEETVTILQPAPASAYSRSDVFIPTILAKWLRPHQRAGVLFIYQCVMGLKDYKGNGCILADDMGLGKTLQSVALIYALLKTGITADNLPTCKRIIVVCPCSLVKNWENEFVKWLGPGGVKTLAIAEADRKTVEKNIDCFVRTKLFNILICSYECLRAHIKRFTKHKDCCDLLVCDEAHRLKNADNQTSRALNSLPVTRRVLLTGTPMQNDLQEFYAMVDFTNPGILGSPEDFRKRLLFPILRGREPDASDSQKRRMSELQNEMSLVVNEFILRRVNTLNAQHLPPKLVQVVSCQLTAIQQNMYQHLISSKDMQHVLDGKQVNCLGSIQMLMKLCNHPTLIASEDPSFGPVATSSSGKRTAAKSVKKYTDELDGPVSAAAPGADGVAKYLPHLPSGGRRGEMGPVFPEWSGKMFVLYRLMREMRKPGNGGDKIVIVSNYTQTLDLIGRMCRESSWGFCRLDGSIGMKKRQKMVDDFNDPSSSLVAFLLSSKAGGCGLNLIGGNRLVLFDPDWNPAVDKQAAARCWRDGQTKRCFTYRFLATGTVEEKIFQRQLAKEGLQSVVDDKEQVNALSTKDLRNLFKLRTGTPSDTHDKLRCERCEIIHDTAEMEEGRVLPKKLAACRDLLDRLTQQDDAVHFLQPLDPMNHNCTKADYERLVKQPMDFGTIRATLEKPLGEPSAYKNVSSFSKDVNRVFGNVLKAWNPGDTIADAARNLQFWWTNEWKKVVPILMSMTVDDDNNSKDDSAVNDVLSQSACVNNERGTDYQEQIGMPDEENMRHWSHHYSTDTVDDPVFRAAMRGFDAVSFVFGLEVTWSLIQQRKQEEEELLAMKELENMQNIDEDEDVDTKPAAKVSAVADAKTETASNTGGELSSEEEDDSDSVDSDGEEDAANDLAGDANATGRGTAISHLCDLEDSASESEDASSLATTPTTKVLAGLDYSSSEEEEEDLPIKSKSPAISNAAASSDDSSDEETPVKSKSTVTSKTAIALLDSSDEESPAKSTSTTSSNTAAELDDSTEEESPVKSMSAATGSQTTVDASEEEETPVKPKPVATSKLVIALDDSSGEDTPVKQHLRDSLGTSVNNMDSLAAATASPVVEPPKWACGTCTLINAISVKKCGACNQKRPSPRRSS